MISHFLMYDSMDFWIPRQGLRCDDLNSTQSGHWESIWDMKKDKRMMELLGWLGDLPPKPVVETRLIR